MLLSLLLHCLQVEPCWLAFQSSRRVSVAAIEVHAPERKNLLRLPAGARGASSFELKIARQPALPQKVQGKQTPLAGPTVRTSIQDNSVAR